MKTYPTRLADHMYDDMWLPDETIAVRQKVREFADHVLRPLAHELNNASEDVEKFPWALVKKMGEAGLFRIPYAAEFGGDGLEYPTLATMVMLEEIAYVSSGIAAALIDVQLILFGHTLKHAQSPVREKLFDQLCKGDIVGAFATSEPAASTDLSVRALQTEAEIAPGGYRLNGRKRWITNSPVAHHMFVLSKLDNAMTMLLVDMSADGVRVGEPDKKMGNHSQLTADVYFENVFVPDENLVGDPGRGLASALNSLTLGRVGIGACGVGMAQAAFDFATNYMQQREIFGQTISQFQYWQFKFADYATQLENARNLYVKAALVEDKGRPNVQSMCSMAKLVGSSLAGDIARDAIQVCGGYGFVKELAATGEEYPLEAIYRDSKIGEIYEGANEIQRLVIARGIFGRGNVGKV
jgi:alkylation response protein AidB-like acyl-CoA dehydrogenase